jgi:hypothetical protein
LWTAHDDDIGVQTMKNKIAAVRNALGGAAFAALFAVSAAQANTLIATGWYGGHETVNVTSPTYGGQAGGFVGTWDGAPIQFWCYELGQSFSFNTSYTDYTVGVPANEDLLSKLFQAAYALVNNAQTSAAFQLAVWEILYDGDLDLFGGSFHTTRVGNATDALAQTWLDALGNYQDKGDITLLHSRGNQDFILRKPPGELLPEPGSVALLGIALVALVASTRRRAVHARGA